MGRNLVNYPQNLFTYSEQFDNAAWTKFQGSVTADAVAGPFGGTTADKFKNNSGSVQPLISQVTSLGQSRVVSVYAKAAELSRIYIVLGGGSNRATKWFNLSNGTMGSSDVVGATLTAAFMEDVGGGWYRCSVIGSSVSLSNQIGLTNADAVYSYTSGNATDGVYLWGAQAALSAFVPIYVQSVASPVNPNTILLPNRNSIVSQRFLTRSYPFSVDCAGDANSYISFGTSTAWAVPNAGAIAMWLKITTKAGNNEPICLEQDGNNRVSIYVSSNLFTVATVNGGAVPLNNGVGYAGQFIGKWVHFVCTWDSTSFDVYVNGEIGRASCRERV